MIPPNISEVPDTVLDCGYGRGSWAVTFAETYPDSEVCTKTFDSFFTIGSERCAEHGTAREVLSF